MSAKINQSADLSEELAALLDGTPSVSELDLDRLGKAVQDLDNDPKWKAEFLKGRFVAEISAALEEQAISQTELANAWGKSRQYVSKLLNEDKRVNFTIETMCELAHLVHRSLDLPLLKTNEVSQIFRCVPTMREVLITSASLGDGRAVNRAPESFSRDFKYGISSVIRDEEYDDSKTHLAA